VRRRSATPFVGNVVLVAVHDNAQRDGTPGTGLNGSLPGPRSGLQELSALPRLSVMVWHRRYSRRQLFANAVIAASRVAAWPCVGVRWSAWCSKESVHIRGLPHRHCRRLHDAADHGAVGEHAEVVVIQTRRKGAKLRRACRYVCLAT
jgi:hypothetical protein